MKKYLLLFFALICLLVLGFDIWSSYRFLNQLFQTMQERREALGDLHQFEFYLSVLKDAETGQRGFIITGDEDYLEPYEKALAYLESSEFKQFIAKQQLNASLEHREKVKHMREIEKKKLLDTKIHVEVKNKGAGISQEMQDKIFQSFVRDPSITYAEKKGTGLELNLAKSIIEKHRGKIGLKTSSTETIFWFELPMFK